MDRTTKGIEELISEIHLLIVEWKRSKPTQQEMLHPSLTDSFGNKYADNPLTKKIEIAYSLLQKYRQTMSLSERIDIDYITAYMELMAMKQEAVTNLVQFYQTAVVTKAEKCSKK